MQVSAEGRKKRDSLELELPVVVRHTTRVLGTELKSSTRKLYAFNV